MAGMLVDVCFRIILNRQVPGVEALGTEKDTFPFSTIELVSVITSFLSGSFKRVNTILAEPFHGRLANSTFRVLDGEFRWLISTEMVSIEIDCPAKACRLVVSRSKAEETNNSPVTGIVLTFSKRKEAYILYARPVQRRFPDVVPSGLVSGDNWTPRYQKNLSTGD